MRQASHPRRHVDFARCLVILLCLSITSLAVPWPLVSAQDATSTTDSSTTEESPTLVPSDSGSSETTADPTEEPTEEPTHTPTETPTDTPTETPTESPTEEPATSTPTPEPTETPTPTATATATADEPTPTSTITPLPTDTPDGPAVQGTGTGSATIHVVDDLGADVTGACVNAFVDAGNGTPGTYISGFCDGYEEPNDAVLHLTGLPVGGIVVRQINPPALHSAAPDLMFTIAADENQSLTMVNPRWAQVTIRVKTQAGARVPGACFWAFADIGGGTKGELVSPTLCDDADGQNDGLLVMPIPAGDVVLEERIKPIGYLATTNQAFHLDPGANVSKTFINKTPTTLIVRTVDVWGDLIGDIDVHVVQTQGGDADIEDLSASGILRLPAIAPGTYEITAKAHYTQPGYFPPDEPVVVTIADLQTKTVTIVFRQAAPQITVGVYLGDVTSSSVLLYWVTDQKTIGEVEYGTSSALGSVAPETAGEPTKIHRIRIGSLRPGKIYYVRVVGRSDNGNVRSAILQVQTATATQNAAIVVTKVRKVDGVILKAACWEVYADAGGTLGTFAGGACDVTDEAGNDGISTIRGLAPGTYWLVESLAPKGYLLAKPRKITLTSGQARAVTVQDAKGGATLHILSRLDKQGQQPGTCFAVYVSRGLAGDGAYVGSNCDNFDGQNDASTVLYGLAPGGYNIYEYNVPRGIVPSRVAGVYIQTYDKDVYATFENFSPKYNGNVVLVSQDASGAPIAGACFWIYYNAGGGAPGEFYASACDGSDGVEDGRTYFLNVNAADYVLIESIAPAGYRAGAKMSFTKTDGKLKAVKVVQKAGGYLVKVTTYKGSTTTVLNGACYALYRLVGNRLQPVTFACDGWDGQVDGITRIVGVPDGTYRLYQTTTPSGYKPPSYVSVTMSGKNLSVKVRTYWE